MLFSTPRKHTRFGLAVLGMAWICGCAGNTGFSGGSNRDASAKATPLPPTPLPSAAPVAVAQNAAVNPTINATAPSCGASGVTQATLLTQDLSVNDPGAVLEYQLAVYNCQGTAETIDADAILFDFDGTSPGTADLDLTITDGVSLNYQGKLRIVKNSDLFGRTGTTYQHYQSDNSFRLTASAKGLRIRVAIGQTAPITLLGGTTMATTSFQLPTYLRLGAALAVERDVVANP